MEKKNLRFLNLGEFFVKTSLDSLYEEELCLRDLLNKDKALGVSEDALAKAQEGYRFLQKAIEMFEEALELEANND